MENTRTGFRYYVFLTQSSIVFIMFYWMDIIITCNHNIQLNVSESVRMCWRHLRASHVRVVNTTQMNYLRETTHPRTAVITGVTRPDVPVAPQPAAVPVAPQPAAAPVAPGVAHIVPPAEVVPEVAPIRTP